MKTFILVALAGSIMSGCVVQHNRQNLGSNGLNCDEKKQRKKNSHTILQDIDPVQNLVIITLDGFRWQEVFNGADPSLINDKDFTPDDSLLTTLYWASTAEERRQKLMPFFWSVIGKKGQVYGNRVYNNKVNVNNNYELSYPGYNEIFTGYPDPHISSNKRKLNPNTNVLEYLNSKPAFHNKVVAFTSWDVFPYIFNENRSGFLINSGYDTLENEVPLGEEIFFNGMEEDLVYDKAHTRYDQLTFLAAREYLKKFRPKVLYLSLGETDEFAHEGRYDLYLQQANQVDKMISDLWHWVQTTSGYSNNTTFVITTDHGRGSKNNWTTHAEFIKGSSQTWLALIGPGIPPVGEVKEPKQLFQQQLAQAIARLLGEDFKIKFDGYHPPPLF
jgi:hypothetical protein